MRVLILTALCAAALGGCFTEGTVGYSSNYGASGEVYASTPDLVTVSPGVQVVADYDEPVFYNEGFYWRYNDGYWYRSNNYASGWYYVERPPVAVVRIDRPYAYAHYRPTGYVARNRARYRPAETITRDHRSVNRPEPVIRQQPNTYSRDHREPYRAAPVVREAPAARAPAAAPRPAAPPAAAPSSTVRDHRAPAKDDRRERDHR